MSDHAIEHDYHLVDPSPWPLLSSLAALVWGLGMVVFFAGLHPRSSEAPEGLKEFFFSRGMDMFDVGGSEISNGGWFFLVLGILLGALVMIGWWRDVLKEGEQGIHTPIVQIGMRYGMILFLMQEVMFFVAWFWMFFEFGLFHEVRAAWNPDILESASSYLNGYGLNQGGHEITTINPWHLPLMNTLVLLLSGTTITWAHHALIKNDKKSASVGLALTIILGISFTVLQGIEYVEEYAHRTTTGAWLDSNIYGSTFFLATGFHGLHVIIGTIFLFVMWLRIARGTMRADQHFGFEAAAWYWHFVDVIWIFLFVFVYIVFGLNYGH